MSNGTKNSISLIGNVGKDPDIYTFPGSGDLKASFSLATKDTWRDGEERKERTQWHNVVVFGKAAGIVKDYVHKGDRLAVDGSMEYRQYDDKDGGKRTIAEVVIRPYGGELTLLEPKR